MLPGSVNEHEAPAVGQQGTMSSSSTQCHHPHHAAAQSAPPSIRHCHHQPVERLDQVLRSEAAVVQLLQSLLQPVLASVLLRGAQDLGHSQGRASGRVQQVAGGTDAKNRCAVSFFEKRQVLDKVSSGSDVFKPFFKRWR